MSDLYDYEDLEPTDEELKAIESGTFDDPEWDNDNVVDLDYPGAEYEFEED